MMRNNLQAFLALSLAAILAVGPMVPTAEARTKKGDKLLKEAQAAEARQQWDKAVELYTQAVDEDPRDSAYLIGMRRTRSQSAMESVEKARELRSSGKMAEAIAELQKAILTDPSLAIALQELKRTQDMLKTPAGPGEAFLTPYERAVKEIDDRSASLQSVPDLNPPVKRLNAIRMNATRPTQVYSVVAAIAGIQVIWDPAWTQQQRQGAPAVDVDIPADMSTRQALEYIATITKTFWKPMTATTIFVTEDNATKRRDLTDQVTKVLYVTNTATPAEFNEIQTAVRTITDIRRVYPFTAGKAIVVRGDVDAVALAEKIVRDLDKPKSEVMIDVIIMEANSARTRDLAATIAAMTTGGLSPGLQQSATFAPRVGIARGGTTGAGATAGTQVGLNNLGRLSTGDWNTSLPGAMLNAMLSDTRTKILSNSQVRTSENIEARLAIGDQIPIAQGNFQTGVTGNTGVGVNTTFQYRDIGTIIRLTPQSIHSSNEVTLNVDFEISAVKSYVDVGNLQQPVFGANKSTATIRMREGEVSILAGLSRQQGSELKSGIPGIIDIPLLGKFLGSSRKEDDRGEIMIALVPHIIRSPDYSADNLKGVFSGTDQLLILRRDAEGDSLGSAPAPAPGGATVPQAAAPKPAEGMRVGFDPSPVTANISAPVTVNIMLDNAVDVVSASPLRITWDPKMMRLQDLGPGELLSRNGGQVTAVKNILNDQGQASLTLTRPAGASGVNGSGALATLTFVGLAPGTDRITVTELSLKNSANATGAVTLGSLQVTLR